MFHGAGGLMQDDAIKLLIAKLTALQGYVREANIKILALEEIMKETKPHRHAQLQ